MALKPGDRVTIDGEVLRASQGRADVQLADGTLARVKAEHLKAVAAPPDDKAVMAPPADKAVRGPGATK